MSDVLQEFLNLGLLDIDGDDSRLGKLRAAASELAGQMKEAPRMAVYHTLVVSAADPAPDDASFGEVAQHVEKQWNTYRNRFPEVPRQLFKAVSLQALSILGSQDGDVAKFAMGYATRSIRDRNTAVREGLTIRGVLDKFDSDLESHASKLWSLQPVGSHQVPALAAPKVWKIDREKLAPAFIAALGPNNAQGQAIPGANPYWPNSNQTWTNEVGSRLAEAVASTAEAGLSQLASEVGKFGKSMSDGVNASIVGARREVSGLEKQTALLWWRKTLYSPNLGVSYRELQPAEAVLIMTLELQDILGGIAPISAEHLLREAVRDVCSGIADLAVDDLEKAAETTLKPALQDHLALSKERAGLQPLAEYLIRVATGFPSGSMNGHILNSARATPSSLACRLLQEMQALELTASAAGKPKGSK